MSKNALAGLCLAALLRALAWAFLHVPGPGASVPATPSPGEAVMVKYRGPVELSPAFACTGMAGDATVRRVCYDAPDRYMLIQLHETWYHYCGIDDATVSGLLKASAAGDYYREHVKRHFDCRLTPPPRLAPKN